MDIWIRYVKAVAELRSVRKKPRPCAQLAKAVGRKPSHVGGKYSPQ